MEGAGEVGMEYEGERVLDSWWEGVERERFLKDVKNLDILRFGWRVVVFGASDNIIVPEIWVM